MSKKKPKIKNQHYVSAFYLRAFSDEDEKLQVFDKSNDRCFPTGANNIAVEKYFYDIPEEWIETGGDVQFVEKTLSHFEGHYRRFHSDVLQLRAGDVLGPDTAFVLAHMVATQYLRTQVTRLVAREIWRKSTQLLIDDLVEANYPQHRHLSPKSIIDERAAGIDLARMMFDGERMRKLVSVLLGKFWTIWLNRTPRLFITSDNPVSLAATSEVAVLNGVAPGASQGVEMAFPLSPTCVLTVGDPPQVRFANGLVAHADQDRIERFNRMQVISAQRHLFGRDGDFEFARKLCAEDPTLRFAERDQVGLNSECTEVTTVMTVTVHRRHLRLY